MQNINITRVDKYKHSCNNCGHKIVIEDASMKCPNCNTVLYYKMSPVNFIRVFKEALIELGIATEIINRFINVRDAKVSDMFICVEMSQYFIDRPMEDAFGGQYKSFLIDEDFNSILNYNFNGEEN